MKKTNKNGARLTTAQRQQILLDQIYAYVDTNLEKRITLQQVADEFGISISSVTQLFQRKAGITFHQFLSQRRMVAAEKFISQGIPLEEVGKHLGFSDHSSFYRAFKHHYGVSPREFRNKMKTDSTDT